jgi:hypothetical protein
MNGPRLPTEIREALDETGIRWSIENGTRHYHLLLGGRLTGILPRTRTGLEGSQRSCKNMIANIRRTAMAIRGV